MFINKNNKKPSILITLLKSMSFNAKEWIKIDHNEVRYVTSQFLCNVSDDILVPNFGRILVASLSNVNVASCYGAIIGILWIIGCSLQGTVLNMFFSVFNVIRYNSNGIL